MKYIKEKIYLNYRGVKTRITEYQVIDGIEVFTLESGVRIVPAHFKYSLATVPLPDFMSWFNWRLQLHYPADSVANLVWDTNPLFARIPKDSTWVSSVLPIPINYTPPKTTD